VPTILLGDAGIRKPVLISIWLVSEVSRYVAVVWFSPVFWQIPNWKVQFLMISNLKPEPGFKPIYFYHVQ
jgi:hypothetical protein